MYAPSGATFHGDGKGLVRNAVVEQAAHDACLPVGITLREDERVWGMVVVECDLTVMVGIRLPAFQPVQALL